MIGEQRMKGWLLGIGALALFGQIALADDDRSAGKSECEQQCLDQFKADREACDEAFNARMKELDAQEAQCKELADAKDQAQCLRQVNIKRSQANNEQRRCYNRANTKAWNCYRQCHASDSRPGHD